MTAPQAATTRSRTSLHRTPLFDDRGSGVRHVPSTIRTADQWRPAKPADVRREQNGLQTSAFFRSGQVATVRIAADNPFDAGNYTAQVILCAVEYFGRDPFKKTRACSAIPKSLPQTTLPPHCVREQEGIQ